MKAWGLFLGASALACAAQAPAEAQNGQPAAPQPADRAAASDPAAASDTGNSDIVVTANRRSQNLMRTPVAASVISGDELVHKGVVTVDSLQFITHSLVVNNNGQGNDFNVRGIGKAEHNTQTETGVITYRDGVPSFPGYFQEEPYFDIANIQVLRGPQGTTVGQNATGGAVFVNTNDPVIGGGVHGYLKANYGNYNDLGGEAAINLPVSDTFAMRLAVHGEQRDSFYHITGPGGTPYTGNPGDQRVLVGRIGLLWKPVDQLSILFKTDLDYIDMGGYNADYYLDRFKVFPGTTTPNPNYTDLFNIHYNSPQKALDKFFRSTLRIQYEFASGTKLRSVSGAAHAKGIYLADLDGTATGQYNAANYTNPAAYASSSTFIFGDTFVEHLYSQEVSLISPDNRPVTWLLGAFGLWDKDIFPKPYTLFIYLPSAGFPNYYDLQGTVLKHSYAAFGEIGFNISHDLKLDLSGRYTTSRATNHVSIRQFGAFVTPDEQSTKTDNFSYKASLGWKVDSNNYLYGFVATGFRPGGLNTPEISFPTPPAPFKPETVMSFEGGWKANFAGGHIRTTVDGFYNNYRHFQVSLTDALNPGHKYELNLPGTTKIYGGEAEADFNFGQLSLSAGIQLMHSRLPNFYAVDPRTVGDFTGARPPCNVSTGPATNTASPCVLVSGADQPMAPNLTYNFSAQYQFILGRRDKLTPRANYGYVGPQWGTLFESVARGDRLEARKILNAELAWEHGSWTVTGYATNLTNQHYVSAMNSLLTWAGAPRQYGVKVMKIF